MPFRTKKITILLIITAITLLANTHSIAGWLECTGIINTAQNLRAEYLTGTAITTILALLFLLGSNHNTTHRCPICDHTMPRATNYCGTCGSRVM